MSDDNPTFPRAAIAMDNGDLVQVKDVTIDQELVGTKIEHTLRQQNAGVVLGNMETKVSFMFATPEKGAERDYFKMLRTGKTKKLRFKAPGETFAVVGVLTKRSLKGSFDSAIEQTIELIGKSET